MAGVDYLGHDTHIKLHTQLYQAIKCFNRRFQGRNSTTKMQRDRYKTELVLFLNVVAGTGLATCVCGGPIMLCVCV